MLAALIMTLTATLPEADFRFLQDLAETRQWKLGRPNSIQITRDGSTVFFLRSPPRSPTMRLFAMDVATGRVREVIAPEQVLGGREEVLSSEERARRERMRVNVSGFTSFALSRDGTLVLVTLSGRAYVVPVAGGTAREVAGPDPRGRAIFDPKLSPDGKKLGFVRAGELWVAEVATGKARQITTGAADFVTHGQAEFVAQEELDRFTGWWWSPDSRSLVYEEVDNRDVEKLWFGDPARPERPVEATPYPRPGKANAKWSFGIVPAAGGKTTWIDFDRSRWEYVSQVAWAEGGPLAVVVLSRDQKDLGLLAVDPATGRTRPLLTEHDDAWVNAQTRARDAWGAPHREGRILHWLEDGSGFLWSTEAGGAWQLVLHAADGKPVRALTPAKPFFLDLLRVDLARKEAVISVAEEPVDVQLWAVRLDGAGLRPLTHGPDEHAAVFARDSSVHVVAVSPREGRPRFEVVRADGSVAGELPSATEKLPFEPRQTLRKVGAQGFWTSVIRPRDFDASRKYPVVVFVYGGPHANVVKGSAGAYVVEQWIADHGYIVVHADGRGTPRRGRAWERAIGRQFATVPLEDQVAALQALDHEDPTLDLTRVGILGHSFGGFMAALAVMRRPDVFRAGVASAPVFDQRNYDTAYTERYLGVPPPAGTSDAFERNGLLPYVGDLTRPLLIVHGTADDNVHFSESLLLADALFAAGKPFELLPLAGQTHMFYEPRMMARYYERVFRFLDEHLGRATAAAAGSP